MHLIWAATLWVTYKNFLIPPETNYYDQTTVLALIESSIAVLLDGTNIQAGLMTFFVIVVLANMRYKFSRLLTPVILLFVGFYIVLNFWANFIDFFWNQVVKGMMDGPKYYHDDDMSNSFSFKVHMFALCSLLALTFGQILAPSLEVFIKVPELVPELYNFQFPLCVSMFLTFLYELTSYDPVKRTRLFRTELTKAFMTCILFQAVTLFMTTWYFSLGSAVQLEADRREKDI